MPDLTLTQIVQHNCHISDARDNGIYSICTLVLKLRNLYKWEHGIEPWEEPESADLLDWIEARENFWQTLGQEPFQNLPVDSLAVDPWETAEANSHLAGSNLVYGSGYGRSMKAIFFLAEKIREESAEGCPVMILGKEKARELSSPFAMLQDSIICIRREPLRFFFWDHIQDIRASCRSPMHHALDHYGLLTHGKLNQQACRDRLDTIVDAEIPIFIYHEVGERMQSTLDSDTLKKIIGRFPDSAIEFVGRTIKDILADTHSQGMINFIIKEKREASLGFYVGFLDGLRKVLFPEILEAFQQFTLDGDWQQIDLARSLCRDRNRCFAEKIKEIALLIDQEPLELVKQRFNREIMEPLGLDVPGQKN
ncbi:MAG: hypothetical protein KKC76_07910 [Proteobacteria bacterium]|nr:hypothetical protein [Pseudomonadota bacterium]MBU4296354.1 hypothetical protein [Pseudomonadota bacterium]MCG2749221.1 hypothetical protein [Desulfobulbaceae bacterium]